MKGPDGFQEDGSFLSAGFSKGSEISAGADYSWRADCFHHDAINFLSQLMVTHGTGVFSHYRGSDSLGNAYQRLSERCRDGPGRDVIAGIDAVKKLACGRKTKSE